MLKTLIRQTVSSNLTWSVDRRVVDKDLMRYLKRTYEHCMKKGHRPSEDRVPLVSYVTERIILGLGLEWTKFYVEELLQDFSSFVVTPRLCANDAEMVRYLLSLNCKWEEFCATDQVARGGGKGCLELYRHNLVTLDDLIAMKEYMHRYRHCSLDSLLEWNATDRLIVQELKRCGCDEGETYEKEAPRCAHQFVFLHPREDMSS